VKIVLITPGSGETFYCENCLRDLELLRALRGLGQECLMVPLYLPIPLAEGMGPESPIFLGGVNVYLQQKSSLFRRTPRWIDRLFDRTGLLRLAGRFTHMTSARMLGETTLSMLEGENGRQRKELFRLVAWLAENHRPAVICLSNALLLGLAGGLRRGLGREVKIACFLQDEDEFLDALPSEYRQRAWDKIAELANGVDAFIAVSKYYAGFMGERLRLPPERLHVVHAGIAPEDYGPAAPAAGAPVLGFLSPLIHGKGLDLLAEAFILLKKEPALRALRLRAAGGGAGNRDYVDQVRRRLQEAGVWADVEFLPNLPAPQRREFLRGLSVLCVPERRGEAAGLYVLEAMASGVPVAQPPMGAGPELIEAAGGGVLCASAEPADLAEAIGKLLKDEPMRREIGERGRQGTAEKFSAKQAAAKLVAIFERIGDATLFSLRK
jgi:glycosyltransferase involved in cell wall biosynthesis